MTVKKSFCKFIFVASLFLVSSCSKKNEKIVFDSSEPFGISPQTQWALVISPYAPIYKEPDFQSIVVTHIRRGEILEVEGRKTTKLNEETIKWIAVKEGWIVTSELEIFSNKLRAENASRKLAGD